MRKRVLIVDDSKSWLAFHRELIQSFYGESVEMYFALSAKEALKIIEENANNQFDLIITDLQMEFDFEPKTAGEWFIEKIQENKQCSDTPIIIISGMINIESVALKYGVEYIPKNRLIYDKTLLKSKIEKFYNFIISVKNNEK